MGSCTQLLYGVLIAIFSLSAMADSNPYRLPLVNCDSSITPTCNQQIQQIQNHFAQLNQQGLTSTRLIWHGQKTPYVFVFIHGVFDGGKLFDFLVPDLAAQSNTLYLVLPGHGADFQNGYNLNDDMWFTETDRAYQLAEKMGEKIIFVTHSIGSALGLDQLLHERLLGKSKIASIVMVEAGFSVNRAIIDLACASQNTIKDARFLLPLARFFFHLSAVDRPIPVHMGCEAGKVRGEIFKRYLSVSGWGDESTIITNYSQLAKKVNIPVLMINNKNDHVVDTKLNQSFFTSLGDQHQSLLVTSQHWKEPHGTYLVKHQAEFKEVLFKFLSDLGPAF